MEEKENKNYFEILNSINVNEHTEKKQTLTYLSWCWALSETLKVYPNMTYEIERFDNNLPYTYDEKTGYMVYTKVTIDNITREMWLPVMDSNNKAMKSEPYTYKVKEYKNGKATGNFIDKQVEAATMFDINKTIMRCLVKNLAMFGLGMYIYAGEDLPEEEAKKTITEEQLTKIKELVSEDKIPDMLTYYKLEKIEDMSYITAEDLIERKTKKA